MLRIRGEVCKFQCDCMWLFRQMAGRSGGLPLMPAMPSGPAGGAQMMALAAALRHQCVLLPPPTTALCLKRAYRHSLNYVASAPVVDPVLVPKAALLECTIMLLYTGGVSVTESGICGIYRYHFGMCRQARPQARSVPFMQHPQ